MWFAIKQRLKDIMEEERVKGFAKVMVNSSIAGGINIL
jgi:hypothetical protein